MSKNNQGNKPLGGWLRSWSAFQSIFLVFCNQIKSSIPTKRGGELKEEEEEAKVGGKSRRGGGGQRRMKVCKLSFFICSGDCETEEGEIWGGRNDER